ncbi:LysR family transcriptional regulator [Streptomyces sp. NPDC020766]|uniref:LysR family transcriptional regulator n=1 Tax=Streptomyces sp. NPDC020766 TaxID=3155011 RepID=UPI0033F26E77
MAIELRHLRAFLAIAEEGNVTRAARLPLGQPALSRTLRRLEDHLGARLVDRSTHHLELTAEGHVFRDKALTALAAVETALDPRELRSRPLRLGHTWAALGDHTIPLLRRWDRTRPGTPLDLLRVDDRTAGLTHGKVDAALLRGAVATAGLRTEPLLSPATDRPVATIEVTNTDEWFIAIAAGRAVGVSTSATPSNHTHPSLVYRPLADADT